MHFRPSNWITYILTNFISCFRSFFPALRQWMWYGFRRGLLFCIIKYAIDSFWLCFKQRTLGVSYLRELSLMTWVAPSMHYDMDAKMRLFIRKCGYHYSPGVGVGKRIQPWFYGDIKDDTKEILERMEIKAIKFSQEIKKSQAEEMQAVIRVLRNFKEFTMNEIMAFFKKSELVKMETGQTIFGEDDVEEYFYGVVSGEIHLYCDGIGKRGLELIKVAGDEDCIVSIAAFLRIFSNGPMKYGDLKLSAVCGASGKYYRIPIDELMRYIHEDKKNMFEVLSNILLRQYKFVLGMNELTGLLPRLHDPSFLIPEYTPIDIEPGIIGDTNITDKVFDGLSKILIIKPEDRKLCWVGVLDSRTVLLRRYKPAQFAFYIHEGLVACTVSKLRRSYNSVQYYLKGGQILGWREAIIGIPMQVQFQIADNAKALIVAIPSFLVKRYFKLQPEMVIVMMKMLMDRFSLLNRQINYSVRFISMRRNEAVYRMADLRDGIDIETHAYLCISGRLRFFVEQDSYRKKKGTVAQYGIIEAGDWFGLVPMYADQPMSHRTVICDRCAEYAAVPRYVMCIITRAFTEAAGYQCDYLARSMHRDRDYTPLDTDKVADNRFQVNSFGVHSWRTFKVICIYPASPEIPAKIYCDELARHHTSAAAVVTRKEATEDLEVTELTMDHEYLLARWIVMQEEKTTALFVLADGDDVFDVWNSTIAKLCDMIQVLVTYEVSYKPKDQEMHMLELAIKARKELVFIHPVVRVTKPQVGPTKLPHLPQGSILWLKPRNKWVQRHHHVRILDSALRYMKLGHSADLEQYLRDTKDPDKHSDFARVMRWISGQSVGVVLGGGGAKGAAHLGALHYLLHELDVPVDYIAGVSIGSFLGALYAVYENILVVECKAKELWEELRNPLRYARDITIPIYSFSSVFRGHSFNFMISYFFEDIQIEDLYVPYFCVSSDLHDNRSRTHMSGDLWFYVRASMTLTMLFPPQINQFDYHLLMDGGYSDLVPAMTMRRLGIKYLVAINIGDEGLMKTFNIGYHVSGLKCVLQNLLPTSIDSIPNHFDFWDAILYCSARNFLQILKAMDEYCIYIRPNINAYTAIHFQNYEEIKTLGYISTKFKFGGLKLKNLPVHVIWYLLRFYTYPYVATSQAQMLQGFTDEDWEFAVNLMSKTQMFQRATTTFLKLNLTPYLIDLMEARPYLESFLTGDEMKNINLHVPVLENFFRDDEKLDLFHAIARIKEWAYMEDFDSIYNSGKKTDLKVKTKVYAVASQMHDLRQAAGTLKPMSDTTPGIPSGGIKESYAVTDLYQIDPTLYEESEEYSRSQKRFSELDANYHQPSRSSSYYASKSSIATPKPSQMKTGYGHLFKRFRQVGHSIPSLHQLVAAFRAKEKNGELVGRPSDQGQRLEEFRKCLTLADRRKDSVFGQEESKLTHIVTLKELRRSFEHKGATQLSSNNQ